MSADIIYPPQFRRQPSVKTVPIRPALPFSGSCVAKINNSGFRAGDRVMVGIPCALGAGLRRTYTGTVVAFDYCDVTGHVLRVLVDIGMLRRWCEVGELSRHV